MGICFSNQDNPRDRVVYDDNTIYRPYNDNTRRVFQDAEFTPEYAKECTEYYTKMIQNGYSRGSCIVEKDLFIEIPCMLPNTSKTYDEILKKDTTNRFHDGHGIYMAYVRDHRDHRRYVLLRPVFKIIKSILTDMAVPYVVHFEHTKLSFSHYIEDNGVLRILFVQGMHT